MKGREVTFEKFMYEKILLKQSSQWLFSNLDEGKFELGYNSHCKLPCLDPMSELGDDEYDEGTIKYVLQRVQAMEMLIKHW